MKALFIDTETTGLPVSFDEPYYIVNNWPRLVQVSWILKNYDTGSRFDNDYIIKPEPDLLEIPAESTKIHGITTQIAKDYGRDLFHVLKMIEYDVLECDLIVAHNFKFDSNIIMSEAWRKRNFGLIKAIQSKPSFDTMIYCTDIVKIPKKEAPGEYKFPKLCELYKFLFGYEFSGAHNSLNDIRATREIYEELKRREIIKETTFTGESTRF